MLAKEQYGLRGPRACAEHEQPTFIPFSAHDPHERRGHSTDVELRKGAADAIAGWVDVAGRDGPGPSSTRPSSRSPGPAARRWSSPRQWTARVLGVIHLKDIVKGGMKERFDQLRAMGIRTVMITGDNPLTAAAIAAEAGVDDFLAQATPEDKLEFIRKEQAERPPGRDDRRRHQRRAGARAGRRRAWR